MTDAGENQTFTIPKWKKKPRIRRYVVSALVVLLLCCVSAFLVFARWSRSLDDNPKHMTQEQVAAFEASYRDKGTVQQSAKGLEAAIARAADAVSSLVPGLRWEWKGEYGYIGCGADPAADTRVTRLWARDALFTGPIPDEVWPQAVQVVRQAAAAVGATRLVDGLEQPGDRDIAFTGTEGQRINLTTKVLALMSGATPCRLREDWFVQHNIPIPGTR